MCACLLFYRGVGVNLFVLLFTLLFALSSVAEAKPAQLSLADIKGKEYLLSDFRGKWVVINYWATWCSPCLKEIPELNELHKKRKENNVLVLGVNFEDAPESRVQAFIEKYNISYPVLLEEVGALSQLGPIEGLPKTFIVSPSGEIVYRKVGIITLTLLEEVLKKLKKEQ